MDKAAFLKALETQLETYDDVTVVVVGEKRDEKLEVTFFESTINSEETSYEVSTIKDRCQTPSISDMYRELNELIRVLSNINQFTGNQE